MAPGMSMAWVVIAAMSAMLVQVVMSKTLTVGDASKWSVPSSPDFYSSWASKQSFAVGDVLEFDFPEKAHTVAQVSKDAYEKCDASLDKNAKVFTAKKDVPLSKEGPYYFICTVTGHCSGGQKLSVTVPSTASSPATPSSPDAPPKSPANGSPLYISAFPVSFLAIIISFAVLAKMIT